MSQVPLDIVLKRLEKRAASQQVVVVDRENRKRVLKSLIEAIAYLTSLGAIPEAQVDRMVRDREPLINGQRVFYPGSEKAAQFSPMAPGAVSGANPFAALADLLLGGDRARKAERAAMNEDFRRGVVDSVKFGLNTPEEGLKRLGEVPFPEPKDDKPPDFVQLKDENDNPLYMTDNRGEVIVGKDGKPVPYTVFDTPRNARNVQRILDATRGYNESKVDGPYASSMVGQLLGHKKHEFRQPTVSVGSDGNYRFNADLAMNNDNSAPKTPLSAYTRLGSKWFGAGSTGSTLMSGAGSLANLAAWYTPLRYLEMGGNAADSVATGSPATGAAQLATIAATPLLYRVGPAGRWLSGATTGLGRFGRGVAGYTVPMLMYGGASSTGGKVDAKAGRGPKFHEEAVGRSMVNEDLARSGGLPVGFRAATQEVVK